MENRSKIILEAKSITKKYEDRTLFENLSFSLLENETVAIQGRSGEGKSTLLNILAALDTATSGELFFQEKLFSNQPLHLLRKRYFGFVFQSFHLLSERSALYNVLLPVEIARWPLKRTKEEWKERAFTLLQRVGLTHSLSAPVNRLSGGEKQRVAIARALILEPILLFLDEPTGNLDRTTADEIVALLLSLHRDGIIQSILMVTHEDSIAKKMKKQYILQNKNLIQIN